VGEVMRVLARGVCGGAVGVDRVRVWEERLDGVSPHPGLKLESENLGLRRIRPRMGGRDD